MRNNIKIGIGFLTVLATPFVIGEVSGNEAQAAQGWVQSGSTWYHYKANGSLTKNAWVGNYWLGADGRMITNSWVDNNNYYVGHDGLWVKNVKKTGWIQSGSSWYYYNNQGQMERNAWVGDYWVGADGRMATSSWVDNNNYYVGSNGVWVRNAKKTGWVQSGSTWYYYNSQGQLERNRWIGDYWVGSDGKMGTNSWVDNNNYYVGADGLWVKNAKKPEVKKTGWVSNGGVWYYYNKEGQMVKNAWVGNYWLGSDGKMATNSWVDNNNYYVGKDGLWERNAKKPEEKKSGWVSNGGVWYYYNKEGQMVKNAWAGDYYLGSDGKMVVKNWIYDNAYKAWYYLGENGVYKRNTWVGNYWVGSNGKMATNSWVDNGRYYVGPSGAWVQNNAYSGYYKVVSLYIPVYDASGNILSHVSKDTILFKDNRASVGGRIPVQVAGLTGYVNPSQVQAVNSSTTFIPDYVSDGKYVYHRYSQYSKVMVARHHQDMVVGKSYYSADGINFGTFKLDHPFQFSNLKSKTNYTAADLNRLYSLMGANDSRLAGKGATFKAAEERYGVNALYLVAHSALESAWGRSKIARDKNNFFGISAYDNNPYNAATKFDNVDAGILGAARWINEKYLSKSTYPARGAYLGNKAGGMNVNYATAPYWGESIASIMFAANEKLGRKDG
ncbi:glucosaminidase domain-containing protein [Gemella morbillorum]